MVDGPNFCGFLRISELYEDCPRCILPIVLAEIETVNRPKIFTNNHFFLFEISLMCCATNLYCFRLWQFLDSLFSKICVENSNSNEVQFDKTTFILLSIAKSNITLRGYKLQTLPKMSTRLFFVARKQ